MSDHYDVCVVGAGAAGLFLASALAERGLSVVLLEAGGLGGSDRLVPVVAPGQAFKGAVYGRSTGWGGTTTRWGGQLWPWEPHEFLGREAPSSVDAWADRGEGALAGYGHALRRLGASAVHEQIHRRGGHSFPSENPVFRTKWSSWLGRRQKDFSRNEHLRVSLSSVTRRLGVTVSRVDQTRGRWAAFTDAGAGPEVVAEADEMVVASGTLGNYALISRSFSGAHPTLGAGFMDHASGRVARLIVTDWKKCRAAIAPRYEDGVRSTVRLVADQGYLDREGLLPSYAHFEIGYQVRESWPLRASREGDAPRPGEALRAAVHTVTSLPQFARSRQPLPVGSAVHLRVDVQQPARRDNELVRPRRSGAGAADVEVRWSASEEERRTAQRFGRDVVEVLESLDVGLAADEIHPDVALEDTYHMMGGTRRGPSAGDGVVGEDLQVHGTTGLYIAGASTFVSGGVANPTFTVLAELEGLAARLGCA